MATHSFFEESGRKTSMLKVGPHADPKDSHTGCMARGACLKGGEFASPGMVGKDNRRKVCVYGQASGGAWPTFSVPTRRCRV